nr:transporter [Zavarzinella formosa]
MKQNVFRRIGMAILATLLGSSGLTAQTSGQAPYLLPATTLNNGETGPVKIPAVMDSEVMQAGCASCNSFPPDFMPPRPGDDGCGGGCVAGGACKPCTSDSWCGRLYCCFYNALCCADPCYEPRWVAGANAALFLDSTRPQGMTRVRWDSGRGMMFPDRNEYFWARAGGGGKGPKVVPNKLNYNDLSIYNEAGTERFSAFVVTPYRSYDGTPTGSGAGFGDVQLGTKSLLLDTEIVQISLQFTTFLPSASPKTGAGVGHVSLEPALLMSVKLHEDTYLQTQIGEWIPLGGDPSVSGALLDYRVSLNHVLCRPWEESQLIGTLEFTGVSFQDGAYTDPTTGLLVKSGGGNYFNLGPGVRWVISRSCDFGFGTQFAVTKDHFANQLYRTEMRFKF